MLISGSKFVPMKFKNIDPCECFMWNGTFFLKLLNKDANGNPILYNAVDSVGLLRKFDPETSVFWLPTAHIEL